MDKKYNSEYIMSQYEKLRKEEVPEKEIAEQLGMTTIELRKFRSAFYAGARMVYKRWARHLKESGVSVRQASLIIGKSASSVRLLMDEDAQRKVEEA